MNILQGFASHFCYSLILTTSCFFVFRYLVCCFTVVGEFVSSRKTHLIITSILIVLSATIVHAFFDVLAGLISWPKVLFDQIGWIIGAAVSAFGLFKLVKEK